jgi:hypothetical protein
MFSPIVYQIAFNSSAICIPSEEQGPISLAQLSGVGTYCQFRYDFMKLKGTAIKYVGALWTNADTEPHAEIFDSDVYQCAQVVQNKSLFSYLFCYKDWF